MIYGLLNIQMASITALCCVLALLVALDPVCGLGDSGSIPPSESPLKALDLKVFADLLVKSQSNSDQPLTALWSRLLANSSNPHESSTLDTCNIIDGPTLPVCQFASKVTITILIINL